MVREAITEDLSLQHYVGGSPELFQKPFWWSQPALKQMSFQKPPPTASTSESTKAGNK